MLRVRYLGVGCAALLIAAPAAAVVPIAGLVNSGVVAGGGAVSTGVVLEANWTLNGAATAWNSVVNGRFPQGPWLADNNVSRWMTPSANAAQSFDPVVAGNYVYALSFDLAGHLPATASIEGRFATDNRVTSITLNGVPVTQAGPGSFTTWTDFSASSGFVAGTNLLQFTVRNTPSPTGNPTGLRVELGGTASVAAIPEPASWALLISGFALVGAVARQRRRAAPEAAGSA